MFVKRLEMHGFKSFADKTTFELTPGITVVVGPNGCGKSNITDAVRWVFGEQSARHLRGARMDDIIFNGSANRKPLSFAEVAITLDNSEGALGLDYKEVSVARRIYRNGESEYLLNKRPCRLKDILELFMDTGIGKEAYSFIGQGRVDEILNARPEERRQIFEEAAGILKYKSRKREAQRRLAETAENLLRVGDIINELSGQLEPLSMQADAARNYLRLRDELKTNEIDLYVYDAGLLRTRWYELDGKVKAAADELIDQQTAVTHRENELTQQQLALDEEQAALSALQREVQQLNSSLEKLQGQTAVIREKHSSVEYRIDEGKGAIGEYDRQTETVSEETARIHKQIDDVKRNLSRAQEDLQAAEDELTSLDASPEALRSNACRDELDKLMPEIRRLQSEHDRLDMELQQLAEKESETAALREAGCAKLAELQQSNEALALKLAELSRQKTEKLQQIQVRKKSVETLAARAQKQTAQREKTEKERLDAQGRLRLLTELEEAMAGYFQGVKSVLTAKKEQGSFPAVFGTVADLVDVPARYVTAVEAAAGPALQNLVAENDKVAKEAITYLKKTKGGRATFLPLNILDVRKRADAPAQLKSVAGYIGVAADLVSTEERFRPVVESLLGRVHLVADLDIAVTAAKVLGFRERVVTLEGDVILPGGAITGGFDKKQSGVLSRRREVDELRQILRQKETERMAIAKEIEQITSEQAAEAAEAASLEDAVRKLDMELKITENDAAYLISQIEAAETTLSTQDANAKTLRSRWETCRTGLSGIAEKLAVSQERETELRCEAARLAGLLSAREQEKRSLRERYTECRVRLASLHKQQEHNEDELERLKKETDRISRQRLQKEEEIRSQKTLLLELEGTAAESTEEAAVLEEKRNALLAGLVKRENSLKAMSTAFREESENLRRLEKTLSGLERKQARQEMERGRVEVELQTVLDRLRESWELEFADAQAQARPVEDRGAAVAAIGNLKEQIAGLGTVNLGAIEEYTRVSERVEFLVGQRDDLREGEKDLLRIIREIDSRMGEKFVSSFAVINEHFSQVFKELFGGGRAYLRLTDPENPLEAGVEIVAQPPGKKLQHLSLLSGGEKALTAIALLFAFLQVKPTPFCILD
ncbi:MAG: chromosome segregation protein SMC, partial [Bacillota bacterium]|nr:chromosome segregation protein SMC [Bacillota bacterium]